MDGGRLASRGGESIDPSTPAADDGYGQSRHPVLVGLALAVFTMAGAIPLGLLLFAAGSLALAHVVARVLVRFDALAQAPWIAAGYLCLALLVWRVFAAITRSHWGTIDRDNPSRPTAPAGLDPRAVPFPFRHPWIVALGMVVLASIVGVVRWPARVAAAFEVLALAGLVAVIYGWALYRVWAAVVRAWWRVARRSAFAAGTAAVGAPLLACVVVLLLAWLPTPLAPYVNARAAAAGCGDQRARLSCLRAHLVTQRRAPARPAASQPATSATQPATPREASPTAPPRLDAGAAAASQSASSPASAD